MPIQVWAIAASIGWTAVVGTTLLYMIFGPGYQIFSNLNVAKRMQPGSPSPDQNKRDTAMS